MFSQNQKPHYEHLKNKWTDRHKSLQEKLWRKHKESFNWFINNSKQLAVGSLGGLILLSNSGLQNLTRVPVSYASEQPVKNVDRKVFLIADLDKILPSSVVPLSSDEERNIIDILSRTFGFKVTAELSGKRLNRNYGLIGAEQHLARYPGDSIESHFDTSEQARKFYSFGMAPGLGAWGYFAFSRGQLSDLDKQREKYYIAVQTFLSEDFNKRFIEYRDFFKYRKMLVVNPNNGKALVADIADSGPGKFTGKHLGGSPEVMDYLERHDGSERGPVLYFFIDDKDDKIPLGPINN